MIPGEVWVADGAVVMNAGRAAIEIDVTNSGDRPIQVGSHFHFFEVNRALRFDRAAAYGYRLDDPAGTAVRFEPGETYTVRLVPLGGARRVRGLNGLVDDALETAREAALARAVARGFAEA